MIDDKVQITAPATKALTALGAGGGASVISVVNDASSFLPNDLSGWIALAASAAALVYTITISCDWWWKNVWRPMAVKRGWLARRKTGFSVDEDGNVTRNEP